MKDQSQTRGECVARALAAAEMGETCAEPRRRASFFALAEHWLEQADRLDDEALSAPHGVH